MPSTVVHSLYVNVHSDREAEACTRMFALRLELRSSAVPVRCEHPTDDFSFRILPFDSSTSIVLKSAGRHEFYCDRHTFMRGEITVTN